MRTWLLKFSCFCIADIWLFQGTFAPLSAVFKVVVSKAPGTTLILLWEHVLVECVDTEI